MRLFEYCGRNGRALELGSLVLYFSYETLVAFAFDDDDIVIRENDWGPTTGKHLNAIDSNHDIRIPGYAFESQWRELADSINVNSNIKISA